jgi:hypothetical protein
MWNIAFPRKPYNAPGERWKKAISDPSGETTPSSPSIAVAVPWRTQPRSSLAGERRITANPVEAPIRAAVVSPDGKYLAYSDPTGTYLRQIENGETRPLPLPKDFKASPSSWFPDSTHLLVTSRDRSEEKAAVWKVSILSGPPQLIIDDSRHHPAPQRGRFRDLVCGCGRDR